MTKENQLVQHTWALCHIFLQIYVHTH
uniref:Uncharacterized protein n=1 Tax=Rhizophora mucronata TaxID=61149 RepID=A0A2P2IJV1_RHIMU